MFCCIAVGMFVFAACVCVAAGAVFWSGVKFGGEMFCYQDKRSSLSSALPSAPQLADSEPPVAGVALWGRADAGQARKTRVVAGQATDIILEV